MLSKSTRPAVAAIFLAAIVGPTAAQTVQSTKKAHEAASAQHERNLQELIDLALAPINRHVQAKPVDCQSQDAQDAMGMAIGFMDKIDPKKHGFRASIETGSAVLTIADGFKSTGCTKRARFLYDGVIKVYTGLAYGALRDRAKIGIDDLR